jgi:transposase
MVKCKKCGSTQNIKNGIVGGRQRYKCLDCGCNFREGDARTNPQTAAKLAMCQLIHAMGKGSFRKLGKLFGMDHAYLYRMIRKAGESLPEPEVPGGVREMSFDEMQRFIGSRNFESSKPLIVAHGEPWPGCSAIVILQLPGDATTGKAP